MFKLGFYHSLVMLIPLVSMDVNQVTQERKEFKGLFGELHSCSVSSQLFSLKAQNKHKEFETECPKRLL